MDLNLDSSIVRFRDDKTQVLNCVAKSIGIIGRIRMCGTSWLSTDDSPSVIVYNITDMFTNVCPTILLKHGKFAELYVCTSVHLQTDR